MQALFSLQGKTAIVTGASRGLGLSMAHALGGAGANLVITARKPEPLAESAAALREKGYPCLEAAGDVSEPGVAASVVSAALERFGTVDVLVNNAGITWGATPEAMPLDRWQKVLDVNLTGTFLMTQEAGRHMLQRRHGSIINIASIAGLVGLPPDLLNAVGYSTTKGALVALTRDLAVKWGPQGVRVNAISPGFFPTKMTRHLQEDAGRLTGRTPLGRMGEHRDLWGPLLLLASDAGAYVTGQCLAVDGGMSCL